jgi:hypothetical protein
MPTDFIQVGDLVHDTGAIANRPAHPWMPSGLASTSQAKPRRRKDANVFIELNTRQDGGCTVSLEWDRDTGETRIVVDDGLTTKRLVYLVAGANAGDAFRRPLQYAP